MQKTRYSDILEAVMKKLREAFPSEKIWIQETSNAAFKYKLLSIMGSNREDPLSIGASRTFFVGKPYLSNERELQEKSLVENCLDQGKHRFLDYAINIIPHAESISELEMKLRLGGYL